MPAELRYCLLAGSDTTLMVWADCDDDCADGEALKERFWQEAQRRNISKADFDRVIFIFAKDRLENWIEFLKDGNTDESEEGRRVKNSKDASEAAAKLAGECQSGKSIDNLPPSLQWSCKNWRSLTNRMK